MTLITSTNRFVAPLATYARSCHLRIHSSTYACTRIRTCQNTHTPSHPHPPTHTHPPTTTHTHTHQCTLNTMSFSHHTSANKAPLKLPWLSSITSTPCHAAVVISRYTPSLFHKVFFFEHHHVGRRQPITCAFLVQQHALSHHALRTILFKAMLMLGKTLLDGKWLSQRHQITTVSCGDAHSVFICKVRMRIP